MVMQEILDYGYKVVAVSKALTAAQYADWAAAGADFKSATYTPVSGNVAAHIDLTTLESVDVYDLNDQCVFIHLHERAGNQRVTTTGSKAVRELATRPAFEVMAQWIDDTNADGVKGVIRDRAGHRLMYVKDSEDEQWIGVFDIHELVHSDERDATGARLLETTSRNIGRTPPTRF